MVKKYQFLSDFLKKISQLWCLLQTSLLQHHSVNWILTNVLISACIKKSWFDNKTWKMVVADNIQGIVVDSSLRRDKMALNENLLQPNRVDESHFSPIFRLLMPFSDEKIFVSSKAKANRHHPTSCKTNTTHNSSNRSIVEERRTCCNKCVRSNGVCMLFC